MAGYMVQIEIIKIQPKDRYPTVSQAFESLKPGEKMELINDHDLKPLLQYKFSKDYPDKYDWSYIEEGPEVWRVSITKK